MLRNRVSLFVIISGTCLFSSCEKGPDPLFTNSVITGYANILYSGENDTILVVATGPYGSKSQVTGERGKYFFNGLGNGTYRLDFIKEGYGTLRQYGLQLFGNDTAGARNVKLFKRDFSYIMPGLQRIVIEIKPGTDPEKFYVAIETGQNMGYLPVVFFMDVKNSVTYKKYIKSYGSFDIEPGYSGSGRDKVYIDPDLLPFESGKIIYIIGYAYNPDEYYYGYFNRYLGMEEYSTLDPEKHSSVMSFIMP